MSEPTVAQRVNHIKKAWHEGRPAYGIITKAPGQSLVRTLAGLRRYGLDFIVMDAEHGNYDDASVHDSIHAIASLGVSPIARCPGMGSEAWGIRVALDAGAHGIMIPLLSSKEQAEDVVHRAKYPPLGGRTSGGSFHTQAFHLEGHGRTLTQEEYWANANDATLIIAIIETKEGLENIDEIVQVRGLGGFGSLTRFVHYCSYLLHEFTAWTRRHQADNTYCTRPTLTLTLPLTLTPPNAIFIGQYDLALSLGSLPQSDKRVIDGVKKIFDSAKKAGVPVIAWSPGDEAKAAVERGYEGIMVGLDMSVLTKAFAGELAAAGAPKRW